MEQTTLKNNKNLKKGNEDLGNPKNTRKKSNLLHTLLLILIIIFLTSVIAVGSIFLFNVAGLKNDVAKIFVNVPLVGPLVKPLAENKSPQDIEREQMELQKKDIAVQMQKLNEKEKQLESKEKELSGKEVELQAKEKDMNETIAKLDVKFQSIAEQVGYIEKMDNSKATQILLNMNERSTVIQILRNMKKDKAASIISLMDPLQAAQLLEELNSTKNQTSDASAN